MRREVDDSIRVASAGTADMPKLQVRADVSAYLASHGLDVSGHRRRTVTADMLGSADVVIAMNTDHKAVLRDRFGVEAPLFTQAAGSHGSLPDVDDLFTPDAYHSPAAVAHVKAIIDRIVADTPALARRMSK